MNYNRPPLRERIARFMAGRYGQDNLYHALLLLSFIVIIVNLFLDSLLLSIIELFLISYAIFRFMSRNVYKRQKENELFLKIMKKPKRFFDMQKARLRDRKTHVFKKCPKCKNTLRLPKKKGHHTAVCPCCQNRFDVKI